MDSWIKDQITSEVICHLQTVGADNYSYITPCLMYFEKGTQYLHPLRFNDSSFQNITQSTKSSIIISDHKKESGKIILLKGKLGIDTSEKIWEQVSKDWIQAIPHLKAFFEIQQRYNPLTLESRLLKFMPDQIIAWKDFKSDPIVINLEIY